MKPSLIFLLLLFPLVAGAGAVRLTVAVPEAEGRVSLGVFDASGRLVRVLADRLEVADFRVELNGIGVDWDGLKDDGKPAANGDYMVRGWFVPETVVVGGDAYYFNGWTSGEEDVPRRTRRVVLLAQGFALIDEAGGVWVSEGSNVLKGPQRLPSPDVNGTKLRGVWDVEAAACRLVFPGKSGGPPLPRSLNLVPFSPDVLAADDKRIFLGGELYEWSPGGASLLGSHIPILPIPESAALQADWLAAIRPDAIEVIPLSGAGKSRTLHVSAKMATWCGERVVWSDGHQLAIEGNGILPTNDGLSIQSLAPGPEGTFWMAGLLDKAPVVRQCAPDGAVLREFRPEGHPEKVKVFASAGRLAIFVILENPGGQRVVGLQPSEANADSRLEPIADWDVYVDVMTQEVSDFGFVDGQPVPSGAGVSHPVSLTLGANALHSGPVTLKVDVQDEEGIVWVKSSDGLRLLAVTEASPRVVFDIIQGALQILVGRSAHVEGFLVKGLDRVVALEGGSVAWSQ